MSLTYVAQQSETFSGRKIGAIIGVVLLHVVFLYAFTHGLKVVDVVQPLKDTVAVFIPEEIPPETPPPAPKVEPVDVPPIDTIVPAVPEPAVIDIPPEVPVNVDTGSSAISTDATSAADSAMPAKSFSITHRVNPPYPAASRRANESGTVLLEVIVGPDGVPTDVNVATSSGYAALDQAAMDAVRKWRFTVSSATNYARLRLPVTFKLETAK